MEMQVLPNAFANAGGKVFSARREIAWGYSILLLFFGGIVAWSLVAPLSTAAIAPGVVVVDGYRKTVQHLEGGIIEGILVRDGDRVSAGQPLVELQKLASETEVNLMLSQRALTAALEARLNAEQTGSEEIAFPAWLLEQLHEPQIALAVDDQRDIFVKRRTLIIDQVEGLQHEIEEASRELQSYQEKAISLSEQRRLARKELREYREMADRGLIPRTHVLAREREVTVVDASISSNQATIASVEQRVGKLTAQIEKINNDHATQVAEQLREAREQLVDVEHRIGQAKDRLARTTVRAPVNGVVVNMRVHTVGGVLKQGEPVLDLVPLDAETIVEARLDPADRDNVSVGMPAEVRLTAFNQRAFLPVPGEVVHVSADAVQQTDAAGGQLSSFYRAKVRFTEDPAAILNAGSVEPGMLAEVLIVTGERTAIEYFVAPLFRSFNRAMHEQ